MYRRIIGRKELIAIRICILISNMVNISLGIFNFEVYTGALRSNNLKPGPVLFFLLRIVFSA